MALYTVVVTDEDGNEVLNEDVDTTLLGSNSEQARATYYSHLSEEEWQGRAAANMAGTEVCPWDCSYCRED